MIYNFILSLFSDLFTEIIVSHPDKRPPMEHARNVCESEALIFKLAGFVGNLSVF